MDNLRTRQELVRKGRSELKLVKIFNSTNFINCFYFLTDMNYSCSIVTRIIDELILKLLILASIPFTVLLELLNQVFQNVYILLAPLKK